MARHPELAAVGLHQGGHRPDERRLPGAVGAEDGEDLPRLGDEVETIQRQRLAEPLREAHCLDTWCHLLSFSLGPSDSVPAIRRFGRGQLIGALRRWCGLGT